VGSTHQLPLIPCYNTDDQEKLPSKKRIFENLEQPVAARNSKRLRREHPKRKNNESKLYLVVKQ
jgi:hypothetical protein